MDRLIPQLLSAVCAVHEKIFARNIGEVKHVCIRRQKQENV